VPVDDDVDRRRELGEPVIVGAALLLPSPLETGREIVGDIGRAFAAEQVERHAVVKVQVALDDVEWDCPITLDVVGVVLAHELRRAPYHAVDPGRPHHHVVRFLAQHETTRSRQGIKAAFSERAELKLPVAVGEVREHEECEPVTRGFVECAENPRRVHASRVPHQELLGLLASFATEEGMEQVDHRPEMAALLDVDLEQIAQVIQARRRESEQTLLLDRSRLGVSLNHEQTLESGTIFARHLLPRRRPHVLAKRDAPIGFPVSEEDPPAILLKRDVAEMSPSIAVRADGRAEVHVACDQVRPEIAPPLHEPRLPRFERALQTAVAAEVDVVGDAVRVIGDQAHVTRAPCSARRVDRCRSVGARLPGRSRRVG
jgi:hypothetical protein